MSLRRIDLIISQCRKATENEEYSDLTGIQDEEFLQYANDAQRTLQMIIANLDRNEFLTTSSVTSVAGQEAYSIPEDALIRSRIQTVDFRMNSTDRYYPLTMQTNHERWRGEPGLPRKYSRRGDTILVSPYPSMSGGDFLITYQQKLPRIDKRRAVVSAVTLNSGASTITSLTLDTASDIAIDDTNILDEYYCSVVDKDGTSKMKSIPITAIDMDTGVVTVDTFTYASGESIAVGDYLLLGKNSTTHSSLDDVCETFLMEYINKRILMRDSSMDSSEVMNLMELYGKQIIETYAAADSDVHTIPVLDDDYGFSFYNFD